MARYHLSHLQLFVRKPGGAIFLWSFLWSFIGSITISYLYCLKSLLWNKDFIGNFIWRFLWSFLWKLHSQAFVYLWSHSSKQLLSHTQPDHQDVYLSYIELWHHTSSQHHNDMTSYRFPQLLFVTSLLYMVCTSGHMTSFSESRKNHKLWTISHWMDWTRISVIINDAMPRFIITFTVLLP